MYTHQVLMVSMFICELLSVTHTKTISTKGQMSVSSFFKPHYSRGPTTAKSLVSIFSLRTKICVCVLTELRLYYFC